MEGAATVRAVLAITIINKLRQSTSRAHQRRA
jgi:hypothetical protein